MSRRRATSAASAALSAMQQASAEWLTGKNDPGARVAYLDHWEYDALGYKRPT